MPLVVVVKINLNSNRVKDAPGNFMVVLARFQHKYFYLRGDKGNAHICTLRVFANEGWLDSVVWSANMQIKSKPNYEGGPMSNRSAERIGKLLRVYA